jgi:hypothetical protein
MVDTKLRSCLMNTSDQTPCGAITKVFTYMAFVYLHLVVHGFQQFHLLGPVVPDVVVILQQQTPEYILDAIIPALFVLGTVASLENRPFFREIFTETACGGSVSSPSKQNSSDPRNYLWGKAVNRISNGVTVQVPQEVSCSSEQMLVVFTTNPSRSQCQRVASLIYGGLVRKSYAHFNYSSVV